MPPPSPARGASGWRRSSRSPRPRSRRPSPRACSQPRSVSRSTSPSGTLAAAVEDVRHGLAVAHEVELEAQARGSGPLADRAQEQLVHAPLARDLGVERDHEHVVLARGDGVAVDGGEDLDPLPRVGDPRRADEHRAHRRAVDAGDPQVGLEGADLAAERVALARVVGQAEVLAVEHDHPRAGAEHRRAGAHELAQRVGEPLALDAERHRRRLAAGHDQPVEPVEIARHADLAHARRRARAAAVPWASKSPCSARTPTSGA